MLLRPGGKDHVPCREIETVEKAEPILQKRVGSVRLGAGGGSAQSAKEQRHEEEESSRAPVEPKSRCAHTYLVPKASRSTREG